MKTRLIALVLAVAGAACCTFASAADLLVETPTSHHAFRGCTDSDVFINRVGTVAIIIAEDCAAHTQEPQAKGWTPIDHPDGGILWWDSQLAIDGQLFAQCTVTDYNRTGPFEEVLAQCLDDPFPPPSATRRRQ